MLNIAICDDESIEIEYLTSLTQEWANKTGISVDVSGFSSAEAFLFKYEEEKNFDILLLDIQMKDMDGIELAEKIRETDNIIQIVFITGFSDYISRGYDVSALHYLIKPVEKEKLFSVLSKATENLKCVDKYILFSVENENIKMNQNEIVYVEAFGHSSCIVSENAEYEVKLSISEIMNMLDESFIYCHRSYIANLEHVSRITKTDVFFDNGKNVPVSRRMYNDVNKSFINFYRRIK